MEPSSVQGTLDAGVEVKKHLKGCAQCSCKTPVCCGCCVRRLVSLIT